MPPIQLVQRLVNKPLCTFQATLKWCHDTRFRSFLFTFSLVLRQPFLSLCGSGGGGVCVTKINGPTRVDYFRLVVCNPSSKWAESCMLICAGVFFGRTGLVVWTLGKQALEFWEEISWRMEPRNALAQERTATLASWNSGFQATIFYLLSIMSWTSPPPFPQHLLRAWPHLWYSVKGQGDT